MQRIADIKLAVIESLAAVAAGTGAGREPWLFAAYAADSLTGRQLDLSGLSEGDRAVVTGLVVYAQNSESIAGLAAEALLRCAQTELAPYAGGNLSSMDDASFDIIQDLVLRSCNLLGTSSTKPGIRLSDASSALVQTCLAVARAASALDRYAEAEEVCLRVKRLVPDDEDVDEALATIRTTRSR